MSNSSPPFLEVRGLTKHFPIDRGVFGRRGGAVRAVDGVSFTIGRGETMGLVGESGSGKSTLGRMLLRLIEPTAGEVAYDGQSILRCDGKALKALRRQVQMVFQDPFSSLNPRLRVGDAVAESMRIYRVAAGRDLQARVEALLQRVGLGADAYNRFPHEFSGGQRQRIGIARALAIAPSLVVCDEPVSSLDVSVQAQVINLLQDLQDDLGLAYLFISHDLGIVRHVSKKVGVMYLGRIVELAPTRTLYDRPRHPYTEALLAAIPDPDIDKPRNRTIIEGDVPSPANPPPGCAFHTRCPIATAACRESAPVLLPATPDHLVACHLRT